MTAGQQLAPSRITCSQTLSQGQVVQGVAGANLRHSPSTQTSSRAHASLHPPQLSGSVLKSTHASRPLPASHWWSGQLDTHCPALQASPELHCLSHWPQWFGSEDVSTQSPPQSSVPARQTQLPALHIWSRLQLLSQLPQWRGSLARSKQSPLQLSSPAAHVHSPPAHAVASTCWQRSPQAPQFLKSVFVSTQEPLHMTPDPFGHWQAPPMQLPLLHEFPQSPQLFGSLEVSTHVPPHERWPAPQRQLPSMQACPAPVQFASLVQWTQRLVAVSHSGVVPLQSASLVHSTHALVLVEHTGRSLDVQFASPTHSTHAPIVALQYAYGGAQSPSPVQRVTHSNRNGLQVRSGEPQLAAVRHATHEPDPVSQYGSVP